MTVPSNLGAMNVGFSPARRARAPDDFYPTKDKDVTLGLLDTEGARLCELAQRRGFMVWEPAAGEGDMAKVISRCGFPVLATDLIDRGYGRGGVDFLAVKRLPSPNTAIITNPPFGDLAVPFIRHALTLGAPYVAMFLKSGFFNSGRAGQLLAEFPIAAAYPLDWRQDFNQLGNPVMTFTWWVWDAGRPALPFKPISRVRKTFNDQEV